MISAQHAKSQDYHYLPFVQKSSKWTEERRGFCGGITYVKFWYGGDTVVNDTTWTSIMRTQLTLDMETSCMRGGGSSLYGYVTEDTTKRKVWYIYFSQVEPFLFRDYDGTIGDTMKGTDINANPDPYFSEVITIDTIIEMNGLKMRKLNEGYYEGLGYLGTFSGRWIMGECPDCISVRMMCYERDGKTIYHNPAYESCWPETTSAALVDAKESRFVANPLKHSSLVRTAGYSQLHLVTVTGGELLKVQLDGSDFYNLNVEKYPSGMYYLVLYKKDGSFDKQKVQVLH